MGQSSLQSEFLSTHQEVHAFAHGIYAGLIGQKELDEETLNNPDVIAEPHYAKGGFILGKLLKVVLISLRNISKRKPKKE